MDWHPRGMSEIAMKWWQSGVILSGVSEEFSGYGWGWGWETCGGLRRGWITWWGWGGCGLDFADLYVADG